MLKEVKKERLFLLSIFLILLIIPVAYAASLSDIFKSGIEAITGRTSVTISISGANDPPNIIDISLSGQTWAPSDGGIRSIEVSFLANDTAGTKNLNNGTAKLNVSLSSYSSENTSCSSAYVPSLDVINYSCTVEMQYWWDDSSSWSVDAEIQDNNGNYFSNNTPTWEYSVLTGFNLSTTALAWDVIAPSETNQSSTTTMTLENTGNRATLDITTKIIDLGGDSGVDIPAESFSVFNSTTGTTECESTNQSAGVTYGAQPIVGLNDTSQDTLLLTLARAQGVQESFYYCLFEVPADIISEAYTTDFGGSWDITAEAS